MIWTWSLWDLKPIGEEAQVGEKSFEPGPYGIWNDNFLLNEADKHMIWTWSLWDLKLFTIASVEGGQWFEPGPYGIWNW